MSKDSLCYTSLLKAPFTLVLNTVSLGNPPRVITTFILKDVLPHVQYKLIRTAAFCTVATGLDKKCLCLYHKSHFNVLKGHNKVSLRPSLLQMELFHLSQPSFIGELLQPTKKCLGFFGIELFCLQVNFMC